MFLLYLVALISVTALPLNQLTIKSHLQNLDFADPGAVQKLKDYVIQMIDKGNEDIAKYTDIRDHAQGVLEFTIKDRDDAKKELDIATANHAQAVTEESQAAGVEKQKKAVREQKEKEQKAQLEVLNKAKETNRTEQIRLNKEKALFEKVKGLLNGVKAEGRRLLDAEADVAQILAMLNTGSNADPAQVEEANKLLDELIAQGEKERNAVVDNLNKQQHLFNIASDLMNIAIREHVLALGVLARATAKKNAAFKKLTLRRSVHAKAVAAWKAAVKDRDTKQKTLETESARIKGEELDLDRIMELLNKL